MFEKHGYDKVTVDQICKELGLTKGAFYYHFRSKADILIKRYKMAEGDLLELHDQNSHLPPDIQLRRVFDWYIDYFQLDRLEEVIVLHKIQMDNHFKNFALTTSLQRKILSNIIQKGQRTGHFKKGLDCSEIASVILTYKWGLLQQWCAYNGNFDFEGQLNTFFEKYLKQILFEQNFN